VTEYKYEYQETIWAVALDTVALERVICSPLDHGSEYPRYVRADVVDRLANALRAQVYEHGPVLEDALDLLDIFAGDDEQ
jgi:hypothetical protein